MPGPSAKDLYAILNARFAKGGEVDIAEQMTVGTIPEGMREPGKAEEAFRALVEGGQGFLGLEPGRRGTEAYRTGQALSNLPVLALPAAAVKGTGKAADLLQEALKKRQTPGLESFLEKSVVKDRMYRGQRRAPAEESFALTQGRGSPSFTVDPEVANVYARQFETYDYGPGSTVVPAYVQMEKPFDIRDLGENLSLDAFINKLPNVDLSKDHVPNGFGYTDIAQMIRGLDTLAYKTGARTEVDASRSYGSDSIRDFKELAEAIEEAGDAGDVETVSYLLGGANLDAFLIGDSKNIKKALMERGFDGVIHRDAFDAGGDLYQGDKSKIAGGYESEYSHDTYRPFFQEKIKSSVGNVGDYDTTKKAITKAKGGEVSTTDFIRKRQAGSPPEGEVPTDDYIQQMMTGTPPSDMTPQRGLVPREIREAVDVPLDFLNLGIRGMAGAVVGPAYGLYQGITSEKFGTPEGVQQAGSEAGKMMQRITGVPKTETAKKTLEFLSGIAEEAKIPPMPQFLTTPAPGPGSANALLRSYELAETAPTGSVKLPGKEGKPVATPQMDAMGLYSPTEQVVMNLPQEKGTAQQMLAQISKAPGSRAAELRATGLEEYLKGKGNAPVTRQEIQDFLKSNPVQINEVVLGKGMVLSPEAKQRMGEAENRMIEIDNQLAPYFENSQRQDIDPVSTFYRLRGSLGRKAAAGDAEAMAEIDALNLPPDIKQLVLEFGEQKNEYGKYSKQARKMVKPQFEKYNIPGGKNAREIYLTLPFKEPAVPKGYKVRSVQYDDGTYRYFAETPTTSSAAYKTEQEANAELQRMTESLKDFRKKEGALYQPPSVHRVSPEADTNRLAHIFLDDRMDAEGKKVLFVQELQSDWGQQGKKEGFAKTFTPDQLKAEEVLPKPPGPPVWKVTYPDGNQSTFAANSANEAIELAIQREGRVGIPTAPFVTSTEDWLNLALKRVIKEAVDTGAENVAFIKGEQAAKKYSLTTVLDGIEVFPTKPQSNTSRLIELKQKGGGIIPMFVNEKGVVNTVAPRVSQEFVGKPLSEIIGKELSEKVMSAKQKPSEGESISFDVEDIEVGGEGMKGFYDNILPKTAEKLLKRLGGGKIETIDLGRTKSRETWVQGREHPFSVEQDINEPFEGRVTVVNKETGESKMFNTRDEADEYMAEALGHNVDQIHLGFKITPEMREMVKTQGLPKFAAGGEVTQFIKAHA